MRSTSHMYGIFVLHPPSSRPSPPGEGELFAVFVRIPATELAGRLFDNQQTDTDSSLSLGRGAG